jgi:hypothetical protein
MMQLPSPADLASLRASINAMISGHLTAEVEEPDPRPERAEPEHADGEGISGRQDASMNDQKGQGSSAPRRRRTTTTRSKASRATS